MNSTEVCHVSPPLYSRDIESSIVVQHQKELKQPPLPVLPLTGLLS